MKPSTIPQAGTVVLLFTAKGCGPCKTYIPEAIKACMAAKVVCKVIDCQVESKIAARYHIQTTPTTLIARDGMVVYQASGALDSATLAKRIREAK